MPTRLTEFHISSQVPSMCLRAKDHLVGTKVAVFPRYCAPQKVQTGSAAAGGHRRVATRKTTGDLATRRGAGDPETRAEWMKVLRYGHLRSAPVVVDAGYARSGNRLHSLQRSVNSTRQSWRLLDGLLPLPDEQITSAQPRRCVVERFSLATRPSLLLAGQKNIMVAYVWAGLSILAIFLIIVVILHAKKNLQILPGSRDLISETRQWLHVVSFRRHVEFRTVST